MCYLALYRESLPAPELEESYILGYCTGCAGFGGIAVSGECDLGNRHMLRLLQSFAWAWLYPAITQVQTYQCKSSIPASERWVAFRRLQFLGKALSFTSVWPNLFQL